MNEEQFPGQPLRVLMVCLGNICRSPTAHAVMMQRLSDAGLEGVIEVDSAGTGDYHIGKAPDPRAQRAGRARGYDLSDLLARQVTHEDFRYFDYLLAMDQSNLEHMRLMAPVGTEDRLHLLLSPLQPGQEVPDPYYGGERGFDEVLDLVETACDHWLEVFRGTLDTRS